MSRASVSGCRKYAARMPGFRFAVAAALTAIVPFGFAVEASAVDRTPSPKVSTVRLEMSRAYQPSAKVGSTDDYHCTLLDPKIKRDAFVTSSQFIPGSKEVHHAALFLLTPQLAKEARKADVGGRGWTCFGAPSLPGVSPMEVLKQPMLGEWAPGHGADGLPRGTGISLPKGSLVIMQVHYNLLVGKKPVRNKLVLKTVPASTRLQALGLNEVIAPPDLPCPDGVTGPLCDRGASLADQGDRFGPGAIAIVHGIEMACGHDPAAPPEGNSTSCSWPLGKSGFIVRSQAHMHLLGRRFKLVLNPGTPEARTILDVPTYNFDDQKAYNLKRPVAVKASDRLEVTCTYDATLAQKLPLLRKSPPHFVTWGDGSTDEMCVGLAFISPKRPSA